MSDQDAGPIGRLASPKSLSNAEYDAWGMRTALLSRGLPTVSLPGDVVFTEDGGPGALAFAQLSSHGTTYGGMGIARKPEDIERILARAGLPAATAPHAEDRPSEHRGGRTVSALVHHGAVLALNGSGGQSELSPQEAGTEMVQLAQEAARAISGVGLAAVRMGADQDDAGFVVTGISHSPHLRDFSAGSRSQALEIAQQLVERTAAVAGVSAPEPSGGVRLRVQAEGAAEPGRFQAHLRELVEVMRSLELQETVPEDSESQAPVPEGSGLTVCGAPGAAALLVTRALTGLPGDDFAQIVTTHPL